MFRSSDDVETFVGRMFTVTNGCDVFEIHDSLPKRIRPTTAELQYATEECELANPSPRSWIGMAHVSIRGEHAHME